MASPRNVLFIMCDQLRADHLSCYGHPHLQTPHIDALAARGVVFDRAYVQSPVCGPSRMSYYTGRYMHSHGVSWNFVPLKAGEMTIGDHLRPLGVRSVLVGKTHMRADHAGMSRMGIDPDSAIGVRMAECGFEPFERDDGIHPYSGHDPDPSYSDYLRAQGFGGDNPWEAWANTVVDHDGTIDFMREAGDQPWVLHLSYIKPHWPYVAPTPYHDMYGAHDILPVNRSEAERAKPHPVVAGFQKYTPSQSFSMEGVREAVIPVYMGLVKQVDDHLGRLMNYLKESGLEKDTLIVFASDHGDYLGDHWLGEKELFHDAVVRVPMIVADPRAQADATRGTSSDALVEAVDVVPTILDALDLPQPPEWLEGQSLLPLLHGHHGAHGKDMVVCENSYAFRDDVRLPTGRSVDGCHMTMLRTDRWKFIHYEGLMPQLFDMQTDPQELNDLGQDPEWAGVRQEMLMRLFDWLRARRRFPNISHQTIEQWNQRELSMGIEIGVW